MAATAPLIGRSGGRLCRFYALRGFYIKDYTMQAYFIKCVNQSMGTEAMSTQLFYFESQAAAIVDTLNAKNDGYRYFLHAANI